MTQRHATRIGRYSIRGILGQGTMGVVYQGVDPSLNRDVAIKVIRPRGAPEVQAKLRRRFDREARALARLDHPNIVRIHDIGQDGEDPYIVMDHIPGMTLAEHLERAPLNTWPQSAVVDLGRKLARALAHAHTAGVLHRDIKPANVYLRQATGEPMLLDFGLARGVSLDDSLSLDPLTVKGKLYGTPAFAPPEQLEGERERLGPQTDIYSLAATLYAALSGKPPSNPVLGDAPASSLRQERPEIHPDLDRLLLACLAADPAERPPTAADVAKALGGIAHQLDEATPMRVDLVSVAVKPDAAFAERDGSVSLDFGEPRPASTASGSGARAAFPPSDSGLGSGSGSGRRPLVEDGPRSGLPLGLAFGAWVVFAGMAGVLGVLWGTRSAQSNEESLAGEIAKLKNQINQVEVDRSRALRDLRIAQDELKIERERPQLPRNDEPVAVADPFKFPLERPQLPVPLRGDLPGHGTPELDRLAQKELEVFVGNGRRLFDAGRILNAAQYMESVWYRLPVAVAKTRFVTQRFWPRMRELKILAEVESVLKRILAEQTPDRALLGLWLRRVHDRRVNQRLALLRSVPAVKTIDRRARSVFGETYSAERAGDPKLDAFFKRFGLSGTQRSR